MALAAGLCPFLSLFQSLDGSFLGVLFEAFLGTFLGEFSFAFVFAPDVEWQAIGKLSFIFTLVSTWWSSMAFVNGWKS